MHARARACMCARVRTCGRAGPLFFTARPADRTVQSVGLSVGRTVRGYLCFFLTNYFAIAPRARLDHRGGGGKGASTLVKRVVEAWAEDSLDLRRFQGKRVRPSVADRPLLLLCFLEGCGVPSCV